MHREQNGRGRGSNVAISADWIGGAQVRRHKKLWTSFYKFPSYSVMCWNKHTGSIPLLCKRKFSNENRKKVANITVHNAKCIYENGQLAVSCVTDQISVYCIYHVFFVQYIEPDSVRSFNK